MADKPAAAAVRAILNDPDLMQAAHRAVEEVLIDFRDRRISAPFHGNGLVVREYDGKDSDIIRLGTRDGIKVALQAIARHLDAAVSVPGQSDTRDAHG